MTEALRKEHILHLLLQPREAAFPHLRATPDREEEEEEDMSPPRRTHSEGEQAAPARRYSLFRRSGTVPPLRGSATARVRRPALRLFLHRALFHLFLLVAR